MKGLIFCYITILIVGYSIIYIFKEKKFRNTGVYLTILKIFNALFFVFICFHYYYDYKNFQLILEEHSSLVSKKGQIEKNIKFLSKNLNEIENNVIVLDNKIDNLENDKKNLENEINQLKKQYNALYINLADTPIYQIENFPTFDQRDKYPNGCEPISLYLLLKYNGVDIDPEDIVNSLKLGDFVHVSNGIRYGANPEIEFVGNPRSTLGYGVFENPIIDVANQFKSGIIKATGSSLSEILKIVKSGKPVQVWASSYEREPFKCNTWIHKNSGKTITWYCNFHSVVLIGATSSKVIVSDPLTGTITKYDREKFEYAYNFYGRRAIYYE